MTTIAVPVTSGRFTAMIDQEDADHVVHLHWTGYTSPGSRTYYAGHWKRLPNGKYLVIPMHRLIMDAPENRLVDHRNGDGLDNRRSNLRLATSGQNNTNTRNRSDNTSGYRGVTWDATRQLWSARLSEAGKTINLGRYPTAEAAARAYDIGAIKLYGDFARLNFEDSETTPAPVPARSGRVVSSKYRGVSWDSHRSKWAAAIKFRDTRIHIGRFDSEEEARDAYVRTARQLLGKD